MSLIIRIENNKPPLYRDYWERRFDPSISCSN
jgi:hypothetical protein